MIMETNKKCEMVLRFSLEAYYLKWCTKGKRDGNHIQFLSQNIMEASNIKWKSVGKRKLNGDHKY